ncbi:MAG: hypothetical protein ACYCQJ_12995 [Nitrososphaerales archaeon]
MEREEGWRKVSLRLPSSSRAFFVWNALAIVSAISLGVWVVVADEIFGSEARGVCYPWAIGTNFPYVFQPSFCPSNWFSWGVDFILIILSSIALAVFSVLSVLAVKRRR